MPFLEESRVWAALKRGRVGALLLLAALLLAGGCRGDHGKVDDGLFCPGSEDLAALVDPMIGTQGSGNAVPGALVPHGMVKLSPDTNVEPGSVDAYEYNSDKIEGFSHTHLQGPGGGNNGYSHILLMPTTGDLHVSVEEYASAFSHDHEEASPGYYAVTLDDYGVRAELTATAHTGHHRYTYPQANQARVIIDLGHSRGDSRDGMVEVVDDRTIQGYGGYNVHPLLDLVLSSEDYVTGGSTVYFHARFSKPFSSYGTWKGRSPDSVVSEGSDTEKGPWIGAFVSFVTEAAESVEVHIGISLVSEEQARKNLEAETGSMSFDEVRELARQTWNCYLNRIQVEGGTPEQRTIFYTALYHTLFAPADYTEAEGVFFSGADGKGKVFRWEQNRFYTDDWCAWDTFRTSRPLATIVEPETVDDVVASYLHLFQQGGWLPKCTWHATGYSSVMIGNHAVSIIADAIVKGFHGFDQEVAWAALSKSATQDDEDRLADGFCGYVNLGTPPEYVENGYVSHECDSHQSASMTLEYAYNDWCIAQVAGELGRQDDYDHYMHRAQNYVNQWNPANGFMQGRKRDGTWVEPFDPANSDDANDFCEASSWIYTWFVPHDVAGLIGLIGDAQEFGSRLDQFFAEEHFDVSNEPSFHVPFLYNYAGDPARTQQLVRSILGSAFSNQPDGLPGNDDAGATSAWVVFGAMGLYPLAPGDGVYQLCSPWFDRTTLHLNPRVYPGEAFVIESNGNSEDALYIQSAALDGNAIDRAWITHGEISRGGQLMLQMGSTPSDWATGEDQ